ncbi:4275_t:CDS:2, partial [Scutellospora calospora]
GGVDLFGNFGTMNYILVQNGIEANVTKTYIRKDNEFILIGDGGVDLFGNFGTMNYILVQNGIEANVTKTYIRKDNEFILIGDGGVDLFGNFGTMNYIIQAKYRTKPDDKEAYVSPKDIREFSAVLMKQPKDTVGFFVSNAKYSNRAENAATNSKLNLILYFFKYNLKISNEKFCSDCKTKKRSYIKIENIEDEAENIILQEELENNYHKIERELISEKWFIDLVEEKVRNNLRQKYPDILFENNRIILTGTIGAGKTTLSSFMSKYFEKKGLKVFIPEEISLKIKEDLDLFCKDKKKYAFFFQDLIIDTYRKMMENIDSATDDYDIIIFDRTYLDTEVFNNINSDNDLKLFYLKTKCEMIDSYDFDYVFYVKKEDVYMKDKDGYLLDEEGKKKINKQVLDNYHRMFDRIGSKYEGGLVLEPEEFDITDLDKYLNEFSELLKMPIKDLIKYLDML